MLKYEPSTVMLFIRLSWPAKVPAPPYCGDRRAMSLILPETVGSVASSSRSTAVAAPVCVELNTGSLRPTTVTVSAIVATFSLNSRSVAVPRLTVTFSFTSLLNPVRDAVTLYGPPTLMPGRLKRPSPWLTAS